MIEFWVRSFSCQSVTIPYPLHYFISRQYSPPETGEQKSGPAHGTPSGTYY